MIEVKLDEESRKRVKDALGNFKGLNKKALTAILHNAAEIIVAAAKANVRKHRRTGMLEKSIAVSDGKPMGQVAQVAVGIKKIQKKVAVEVPRSLKGKLVKSLGGKVIRMIKPYKYAHLVEWGFLQAWTGNEFPGVEFMTRAVNSSKDEMVAQIVREIEALWAQTKIGVK